MAGTLMRGIRVDPAKSLRALVDRDLRARRVAANRGSDALRAVRASGAGQEYRVDREAGSSRYEQRALIRSRLMFEPDRH